MQPRNDLIPRLDIFSHVTKRGYRSTLWKGEGLDNEKKEDVEEDVDVAPRAAREDVAEEMDNGVEELEDREAGDAA